MRHAIFLALIAFTAVVANAQGLPPTQDHSAPVEWKEYQISSQNISITLPKVPVVRNVSDSCSQTEGRAYHAFAAGVVYEFEWHAKSTALSNIRSASIKILVESEAGGHFQ